MECFEFGPGVGLDCLYPGKRVLGEKGEFAVVALVVWRVEPAVCRQVAANVILELDLVGYPDLGHLANVDFAGHGS